MLKSSVIARGCLVIGVTASTCSAGWISWCSTGVTTAAIGVEVGTGGVGSPVAAGGGVVQVLGLGLDAILTLWPQPEQQPSIAAGPEPAAYTSGIEAIINADYQQLPLPGTGDDAFVASVNVLVQDFNTATAVIRGGGSDAEIDAAAYNALSAIEPVSQELQLLNPAVTVTQSDIDTALAQIAASGLPSFETSYLTSSGWSDADVEALGSYVGGLTINLAVPSVTFGECTECFGETVVPEPRYGGIAVLSGFGLLLWRQRFASRRRR